MEETMRSGIWMMIAIAGCSRQVQQPLPSRNSLPVRLLRPQKGNNRRRPRWERLRIRRSLERSAEARTRQVQLVVIIPKGFIVRW
jgi:hypothetical protein